MCNSALGLQMHLRLNYLSLHLSGLTLLTYPSRPASAEKFPPTSSLGTLVTIDSPVLAASVPLEICRSSCNTLMSCDCSPPSDTDTFISRTGVQVIVLKVAIVLRNT